MRKWFPRAVKWRKQLSKTITVNIFVSKTLGGVEHVAPSLLRSGPHPMWSDGGLFDKEAVL